MSFISKKHFYFLSSLGGDSYQITSGINLNQTRYFKESPGDGAGNDDGVFVRDEMVAYSLGADFKPAATEPARYYRGRHGEGILVPSLDGFNVLYADTVYSNGYTFTLDTSDYVLPDTTPPAAPTITGISGDGGTGGDGITNDPTLSLSGTAEANSSVEVFKTAGGVSTSIGTTNADGSGNWTFDHTGVSLAEGSYSFTAKATDASSNTSDASSAYAVVVDTTAPTGLAL
ncbi:MAG TPA: Ig-like domain-containing protein, partial [Azospirillum sp.]|nr:Ig-like domain-containing protein [Azospirillum sp.]